jgi:hypothetical protein
MCFLEKKTVVYMSRGVRALFSLSTAAALLATVPLLSAGLLPGNIWPNPSLELDSSGDGVPDFWNLGGSDTSIDLWSTALWVSPTHSLELNDANTNAYGEWYSDLLPINAGATYQFRYNLYYMVTNVGPMRVSVNFYDSSKSIISDLSYTFSGAHAFWQEITQQFAAPTNATALGLTFTSGGGSDVTGQAWLDDVSLAVSTNSNSPVPYLESFPPLPTPLVIQNWKQTASNYHQLAFNSSITGSFLPLLYQYTADTAAGYAGPAFSLPSYVGETAGSGEALSVLGATLGGTLAGLNMASFNGIDCVQECESFYSVVNGHGLVLNNVDSQGSGSAWYDIFPSTLFYHIGSRYPSNSTYRAEMRGIADSWLAALPVLSNNWDHTDFDFQTMTTVTGSWIEPDMAAGIAWLEYMAYVQFQDDAYLAAADTCLTQMSTHTSDPLYELLEFFGPLLASRMDAELGRNYSTSQHLNWVFTASSDTRPGWGCEYGQWGNYDAYGLMGSTIDTSGYAFSMNTYTAAGLIAPVARYQPQYARLLGRWLLHVAANANLFYPDTLPTNMQSSAAWVRQTGVQSISYEGVRNLAITTPYATGDATAPILDLNPYGAWGSGWMAALFQTSSVPGILQIDCLATEAFPPPCNPTSLLYNPYAIAEQATINIGADASHLYDAVAGVFVATNVTGNVSVTFAPDAAVVLAQCPAAGVISQAGQKLFDSGIAIDYWNATKDTDGDGLPDWWESFYYGNPTNALPQTIAANGFSNLQCYWLGLDPNNPLSTFKTQGAIQSGTGYPQISWNSIGGKTYTVEYANDLALPAAFTQVWTVTETNVPAGVQSTQTFVDNYTLTGGPPGPSGRYYRVTLVAP